MSWEKRPLANNKEKREFLEKQKRSIDLQQAEQDYKKAEFYRRTGHPGSAYWYYELVQRRYPGTVFADKARDRWSELREEVAREQGIEPSRKEEPRSQPPATMTRQPAQQQPADAAPPRPLPRGIR